MIRKTSVLLILCTISMHMVHCTNVINAASNFLVSDSDEIAMGQNVHAEINSSDDYPLYTEKHGYRRELVDYIDSIGRKIAGAQNERQDLEFHFTIIDNDDQVNAFAVPGGYVYVYTGLIKKIIEQGREAGEGMLAGVIAHEIAHVTLRHGVQIMVRNNFRDIALDLIVGDSTGIRTALDVVGGLRALSYSRDYEDQADTTGLKYLAEAGFNPVGMEKMLQMLTDMGGGAGIEVFSTHPEPQKRVDNVNKIIDRSYSSSYFNNIPEKPIPFQQGEI